MTGMTHRIDQLDHQLDDSARCCRAVIETPASARAKFGYDPDLDRFVLKGVLPAGMAFPLDFGFIPGTLGEDGDPVDVLVLSEAALPVGCVANVRLIGVIEAEQTEAHDGKCRTVRNDRLVARLAESRAYENIGEVEQLGDGFTDELARFFTTYNSLKDKKFEVLRIRDSKAACDAVQAGSDRLSTAGTPQG
jgi:inorganic pyrophosphatase